MKAIVFMFLALLAVPGLAQPTPAPEGEFAAGKLELSPMLVTGQRELPAPESWRYARIEGFEVLSGVSEQATRRVLKDFTQFRRMIDIAWPQPAAAATSSPLILCDSRSKFESVTPPGAAAVVSHFLRDRDQSSIVLDLGTSQLAVADAPVVNLEGWGAIQARMTVDFGRQLQREYVRFLLARGDRRLPPWVVEGLAQIVMDIEFTDRWIICGKIDENKGAMVQAITGVDPEEFGPEYEVGDQPFNAVLHRRALLPLERFFAITADDPAAANPLGNSLWAKQAYAFVHLCLFRADGKFKQPFARFVERLQTEPLDEKLFQECFNLSYREMQAELRDYINFTHHKYRTTKLDKESRITAEAVQVREATQGEIARIKGDAQRLAGRRDDALFTYRVAFARGERDGPLLAALGLAELQAGEADRARKFLEAAAQAGADRPSAYLALVRMRLDEIRRQPGATGQLDEAQARSLSGLLERARKLPPSLPQVYELMAEVWLLSPRLPSVEEVRLLGEGVLQFPAQSKLTWLAALLHARVGEREDAEALIQLGLRFTSDATMRGQFEALQARLRPVARAAGAPKSP